MDKYKSDEQIQKEFEDYKILKLKFTSKERDFGYFDLSFPNASEHVAGGNDEVRDGFIVYDDGRVAFDNWYPENIYNELKSAVLIHKHDPEMSIDGDLYYLSIEPQYDDVTPKSISQILKSISILYPERNYIVSANGFVFDGLTETNINLLKNGFVLTDKYTNEEFVYDDNFNYTGVEEQIKPK